MEEVSSKRRYWKDTKMATGEFLTFENVDREIYVLRSWPVIFSMLLYENQLTVSFKFLHLLLFYFISPLYEKF